MPQTLFTSGQVAKEVGLPRWQLLYLIEKGDLPGPSHFVPGRRLFSSGDIFKIVAALEEAEKHRLAETI